MDNFVALPNKRKIKNITGKTFGRITVLGFLERKNKQNWWNCVCVCGATKKISGYSLQAGITQSCGCLQRERVSKKNSKYFLGDVVFDGDVVRVPLSGGGYALVDDNKYPLIEKYRWRIWRTGNQVYAKTAKMIKSKNIVLLMHRIIANAPQGMVVDHINGDGLDNRISNLRICSIKQNVRYSSKRKKATSPYKGVCWKSREGKWWANIIVDGHRKHLGYFNNEIDAAIAYDRAATIYFGEYARLNFTNE